METAPASSAIKSVKPLGATATKRPTIIVEFTKGTILNSAAQWVELLVDGQKIGENIVSSAASEQDGLANIYANPATVVYIDHAEQHKFTFDLKCQSCHSVDLMNEHLNNTTTAGKNFTCNTCHSSNVKAVKRSINTNNLNCSGCHTLGHNSLFADKVPGDIPLYNGFSWSTPIEAALYQGEPGVPVGFELGQVVISNRRSDVTAEPIWNFYNDQLTAGGWILKSGQHVTGNQFFSAKFEKSGRLVTVMCFNTETRDGSGPVASTGFRIEIWYK